MFNRLESSGIWFISTPIVANHSQLNNSACRDDSRAGFGCSHYLHEILSIVSTHAAPRGSVVFRALPNPSSEHRVITDQGARNDTTPSNCRDWNAGSFSHHRINDCRCKNQGIASLPRDHFAVEGYDDLRLTWSYSDGGELLRRWGWLDGLPRAKVRFAGYPALAKVYFIEEPRSIDPADSSPTVKFAGDYLPKLTKSLFLDQVAP